MISRYATNFLSLSSTRNYREKPTNWNTTHSFVLSNPLLSLLEKCRSMPHLKQIQSQMILTGLVHDTLASSRLIAFCALSQLRCLHYCTKIINYIGNCTVFSWNVAIRGHSETKNPRGAAILYRQMLLDCRSRPDNYTYPPLLRACANISLRLTGHAIMGHVLQLGFGTDSFVHNGLIHMFVSCGDFDSAHKVFGEDCVRDLVSWNSLINGYVRSGKAEGAIQLYRKMKVERVKPDEVTMIGLVSSCAQLNDLNLGRELHCYISANGLNFTIPLTNALMDMYFKCGDLEAAQAIFDSMEARSPFSWTTMVVGYAKFGFLDTAQKFFADMPEKGVVPWNAIIGAYAQAKRSEEALSMFQEMQASNVKPDEVTMINCLSACSQLGALDVGMWIHHYVEKQKLSLNVSLGTALVDMYAKCGDVRKALQVFWEMPRRNSLTWTAIICGLASHGHAQDAISKFSEMIEAGLVPDEVTFVGVLSACCHGGFIEEGRKYFFQMRSEYNLSPKCKHYSCMVDLLGRAGLLEEAEELISSMPIKADVVVWGALFFACRIHRNISMGERAALRLLELDPCDSGIYVLLANMYGEANMWKEARNVRKMMSERGIEKTPGCSSIEVNGTVFEFIIRDESHSETEQIYACLINLTRHLQLAGCLLDVPTLRDDFLFGFEAETREAC